MFDPANGALQMCELNVKKKELFSITNVSELI